MKNKYTKKLEEILGVNFRFKEEEKLKPRIRPNRPRFDFVLENPPAVEQNNRKPRIPRKVKQVEKIKANKEGIIITSQVFENRELVSEKKVYYPHDF